MAATAWKGYISFGLVSIPVRLYTGARGKTVSFHLLHKTDNSRVREVMYCAAEDKPLTRADIVKGYEYKKGQYVIVTPDEIKKVAPRTETTMEILQFVKGDEIDPIYFESSYYVATEALCAAARSASPQRIRRPGQNHHAWPRAHCDFEAVRARHHAAHHVLCG
jgi:DNA end-binding protein Ku